MVRSLALTGILLAVPFSVSAATLQVSPINIEVLAPATTATETLSNIEGKGVLNCQVRVFKWTQVNGVEKLEPTKDVVASPPALTIKEGANATVRIVRLSKTPIVAEETYRLLVDEIPPAPTKGTEAVAFAVRHNIPVFFAPPGLTTKVAWSAKAVKGGIRVIATNSGQRHIRVASLQMSGNGETDVYNNGLAGYALAGNSNGWLVKSKAIKSGSTIKITAKVNDAPVTATVQVQ
ncbi:MAG: molecular chaperone [Alphaproteobacteria bacterium]|nr:molecular chaperone [Alphaproteobacteria bacterium]